MKHRFTSTNIKLRLHEGLTNNQKGKNIYQLYIRKNNGTIVSKHY